MQGDPKDQLKEEIYQMLEPYEIDCLDKFSACVASSLILGTPDLKSVLDREIPPDDISEVVARLMELLIQLGFAPPASPASIAAFLKYILPTKISLEDFHKVEECALQQTTILHLANSICDNLGNPVKLFSILFYLIKRGQRLIPLITTLRCELIRRKMDTAHLSLRFFINVLLFNCNSFLRQVVVSLLDISNAVPLDEFSLVGGTLSLSLISEPYWVMEEKFILLSYGLSTCKGKSSFLNKVFGTTFEVSNNSLHFCGTVDMQSDKMFICPRRMTILDSHGVLGKTHKKSLLALADAVIIHVDERLWQNRTKLNEEIGFLSTFGLKFILVVVRDVAALANKMDTDALGLKLKGISHFYPRYILKFM